MNGDNASENEYDYDILAAAGVRGDDRMEATRKR